MEVGKVKIAEDSDFCMLKKLIDSDDGWKVDFDKSNLKVWVKLGGKNSTINMIKMKTNFEDISAGTLYDVLHDPDYRKEWDTHMIASYDIGHLNPNNDVGYYAMSCPPPMKNRDFVLQRSWLDMGDEKLILNHSVFHKDHPPKKGFVRGTSHITGFVIRTLENNNSGCFLGYVSQTDPQGKIPPWLVNKVTQLFGPKLVKKLYKAAKNYTEWKRINNASLKPWYFPEQMVAPRILTSDCVQNHDRRSSIGSVDSELVNSSYDNYNE